MPHPPTRPSTLAPSHGFTLIEVMVTVALLGILAAIAFPSYTDYIIRGRIPEATGRLAAQQVRMEQYFQDNRTYVGANTGTLPCAADTTTSRYFDFDCTAAPTAAAFTLRATGKVSMAGFVYTVNQAGTKATTAVPAGWTLPNPNNCWIVKKGGQC